MSRLARMYDINSSVPRGFPTAAISSASAFILAMYSDAVMAPFFMVARAILVFTALARVYDEKTSSTAAYSLVAVVAAPT
jgi:hypothetical protein